MSATVAIEVLIRGRVQGVYFRAWTAEQATRRGLSGWVRNNADRSVSALFMGPRAIVDDMVKACRDGPHNARVEAIETALVEEPPEDRGFNILR